MLRQVVQALDIPGLLRIKAIDTDSPPSGAMDLKGILPSAPPFAVVDDIIVSADSSKLAPIEKIANASTACDGLLRWTEWVEFHAVPLQKNVVADEHRFLEDVESEAGSMAVDMEGFDAMVGEVLVEILVKTERPAELMPRIRSMDEYLGTKKIPIEIAGAEEMVMGEQDKIGPWK